ncbi:MAG: phosphoglycerate dehydrogenase [Propionibacteriaceae bacterium]|jgi:D-3-phosphoglycerate dehydrogenase|nr:phosphoglycerate dehydrogenase [Propionibacteriaceae bacterium]
MSKVKALLLENIHPSAVRILTERGIDVETRLGALDGAALIEALQGIDVIGIRSRSHVTADVLAACPDLKAVGAFCIGTNQIDLEAASGAGVAVFNAPFSNTRSVVELVLAEIIALARRLTDQNQRMQNGVWMKSASGAHEVRGRTLGIVGYGNIGSQLSVLAEALGMRVVYFDVVDKLALGNAQRCDRLEDLLEQADFVSLHVDGRPANAGFFGADQLAEMKPKSFLINLCRGSVVDLVALQAVLESNHLAGAALDVFPDEPANSGDSFQSPLQGMANVILTPHVGGSTQEAQNDIGHFVAGKLADYLQRGSTSMSVNLPEIQLEATSKARLVHLHTNVPGVLAQVNSVLGQHRVNVAAQQLVTRGQIGYMSTDLDDFHDRTLMDELQRMPQTIRVGLIEGR